MSKKGLLIDYKYCTGCLTCEVACKQENQLPVGNWGVKVSKIIQDLGERVSIYYAPVFTELCNLCAARVRDGKEIPSCVKHCQAGCMKYGLISELVKEMETDKELMLVVPR
jgi:Fe-S-cluster-containing dehydrogenase component